MLTTPPTPVPPSAQAPPPDRAPLPSIGDLFAAGFCAFCACGLGVVLIGLARAAIDYRFGDARELIQAVALFAMFGTATLGLSYASWRYATASRRRWRKSTAARRRTCARCGYDVRGGGERCPECGEPIPDSAESIIARLEAATAAAQPFVSAAPADESPPPAPADASPAADEPPPAEDAAPATGSAQPAADGPDSAEVARTLATVAPALPSAVPDAIPYFVPPPRPPWPTAWDVIVGLFCLAMALLFSFGVLFGVVATVASRRNIGTALMGLGMMVTLFGLPAALLYAMAFRAFTRTRRDWRNSTRTRRKFCVQCGYDLRGGATAGDQCPECGHVVPEPIERTAARLAEMLAPRPALPPAPPPSAVEPPD